MGGLDFCLLPSHLYDLTDPDHADHDLDASPEARARAINENSHNIDWVGLGPYRMTKWVRDDYIEAVRFDDYFEQVPARRGYVDVLRWKYIKDDNLAFEAVASALLRRFVGFCIVKQPHDIRGRTFAVHQTAQECRRRDLHLFVDFGRQYIFA